MTEFHVISRLVNASTSTDLHRFSSCRRPTSHSSARSLPCMFFSLFYYYYIDYLPTSNQLYASADAVIILNARTLALVRVLAFWEAFPGTMHTNDSITCISIDSGMKLVRQFLLITFFPIYICLIEDRCRNEH